MNHSLTRLLLLILLAVTGITGALAAAVATTNQISATSILKDIRNEIHDYSKIQSASLLVLVSLEDDRPVYIDHALLLLKFSKGKWTLVNAIRAAKPSPVHPTWDPKWRPHDVRDAPYVAEGSFDHPPNREELNRFLQDNRFPVEGDEIFRVVERKVDDEAWQKALGYPSGIKPLNRSGDASPADKRDGATSEPPEAAAARRLLGRWELPGGKEPMVFAKDGKCEVHFSDGMIKATYTISAEGKITVNAKTKDITLTLHFHFEGDRLTDGVVYFEGGKRYWRKAKQ